MLIIKISQIMEKTYKSDDIKYLTSKDKLPVEFKDMPHFTCTQSDTENETYKIEFPSENLSGNIYGEMFSFTQYYFMDSKDFRHNYISLKKTVLALYIYLKFRTIIPEDEF